MVQSVRPAMRFSKNGVGTAAVGWAPSEVTRLSWVSAVGSSAMELCSRWRSMAKKANSLSFFNGPPTDPPNHWREYGGVVETKVLFAGSGSFWAALSACARKNPNTEPWEPFDPDLAITLLAAPSERRVTAHKRTV